MSCCRWSSGRFSCDLYCYQDVSGGWTTHVAGSRIVGECPPGMVEAVEDWVREHPNERMPMAVAEACVAQQKVQRTFLEKCNHVQIGGPHDGKTFNDETLEDFRDRLVKLRADGYRFPDSVLEEVEEEISDSADG